MPTPKVRKSSWSATRILIGLVLAVAIDYALLYGVLWAAEPRTRTQIFAKVGGFLDPLTPIVGQMAPVWADVEPGIRMELDPHDLVARNLLVHGEWEKASWERIDAHLPAKGVFIDVGAHIGYYSLKAAKKVGFEGSVLAVEPNPETLVRLQANLDANAIGKIVKIAPVACSDREATLEFFASPRANTGESSLSRKNASQEGQDVRTYQVHARPLDDIVDELGLQRLDVLKIDVEGADFMVLKGAERALRRFHPVLYVETVDPQLKAMGSSVAELNAFVLALGYKANPLPSGNTEFLPVR